MRAVALIFFTPKQAICTKLHPFSGLVFFLFGAAFSVPVFSQSPEYKYWILQAESALQKQKPDSALYYAGRVLGGLASAEPLSDLEARVNLVFARANRYKKRPEIALKFYLKSKNLYEQKPLSFSLGRIYKEMGELYEEWGLEKKAKGYYLKSYPIYAVYSEKEVLAQLVSKIARFYHHTGDYASATKFYQYLLKEYEKQKNYYGQIDVLKNISDVNLQKKDYTRAVTYQLERLRLSAIQKDTAEMMKSFYSIADLYKQEGKHSEALNYFQRYASFMLLLANTDQDEQLLRYLETMSAMGQIYEAQGKQQEDASFLNTALSYYAIVLNVLESTNPKGNFSYFSKVAETNLQIARTYNALTDYRNAVFYAHKSLENLRNVENPETLVETYQVLIGSLRKLRKFRSALRYYDKLLEAHNQLSAQKMKQWKKEIYAQSAQNKRQFIINKTEQTISDQQFDSLAIRQLALLAAQQDAELKFLKTARKLQDFAIANQILQKNKTAQDLMLAKQELSGAKKEQQILALEQQQFLQSMELQKQRFEQEEKEHTIELLEMDKALKELALEKAEDQTYFYRVGISLISLILISILASLLILRRTNRELSVKNAKIEQQSDTLRQANADIGQKNQLIARKNEELIMLNKEKNHIIGIIAHDLRNPLSISLAVVDFVGNKAKNFSEEQREGLSVVRRSLQRMSQMIVKILDVRAIEAKQLNLNCYPLNVDNLLAHTMAMFREKAKKKDITVVLVPAKSEVFAMADEQYLTQVLENLLSNALKFSPINSSVKLLSDQKNGSVRIAVQDNGPGISAADQKKLFGKFQKLTARPTGGEQSIGLGLSIAKKYVLLMNGQIYCESQLGKGSTFWVELPEAKAN